jgi:hypothetical protein
MAKMWSAVRDISIYPRAMKENNHKKGKSVAQRVKE